MKGDKYLTSVKTGTKSHHFLAHHFRSPRPQGQTEKKEEKMWVQENSHWTVTFIPRGTRGGPSTSGQEVVGRHILGLNIKTYSLTLSALKIGSV